MKLGIRIKQRQLLEERSKLDRLESELEQLRNEMSELAESVDNATSEEIGEAEKLATELEEKEASLNSEIEEAKGGIKRLEEIIDELSSKNEEAVKNAEKENKEELPSQLSEERKEIAIAMNKRFKEMNRNQRRALIQNEEVASFVKSVRGVATNAETRVVKGAEITIPSIMVEMIRENLETYSMLYDYVNVKQLDGKARQPILGVIPEAVWTEACGKLNELNFGFYAQDYDGYKVAGFFSLCNAALEDSDEKLAVEILDAIATSIGIAIDRAILFGTGKKMPLGIVTRLAQASKPSEWGVKDREWTDLRTSNILKIDGTKLSGTKLFEELIPLMGVANPAYSVSGRTFWAMNRTTKTSILSKMVAINAAGAIVAGNANQMPVIGGDIVELPFIEDGTIIGGFGDLYNLIERSGMAVSKSEHAQFIEDNTLFKGVARYDGMPVIGEAFVAINIKNVEVTTTSTFPQDEANG